MNKSTEKEIVTYLSQFVSENKLRLFEEILNQRTRYITTVLEDIYQSHNASACIRTCECFGIQDIHVIENSNHYTINPDITLGSSKWINLIRYNKTDHDNTGECLKSLKQKGYTIIATSLEKTGYTPSDIPLDKPLAFLFGTEEKGLTDKALDQADKFLQIPMYGFTNSFNISVSVALSLYRVMERLRESDIEWRLLEDEKLDIRLRWIRKVVKKHKLLEKKYFES